MEVILLDKNLKPTNDEELASIVVDISGKRPIYGFVNRTKSLKHHPDPDHDQSTHGNWANEAWINDLSKRKVVGIKPLPGGVTKGKFIEFDDGTVGVWKPLTAKADKEYPEETSDSGHVGQSEVLAYKLGNLLGIHTVPPTDYYEQDGVMGTIQKRVPGKTLFDKDAREAFNDNLDDEDSITQQEFTNMILLDTITDNRDRHASNMLFSKTKKSSRLWAIDNGHAAWGSHFSPSSLITVAIKQCHNFGHCKDSMLSPSMLKRWKKITKADIRQLFEGTPISGNFRERDIDMWTDNAWDNMQTVLEQGGIKIADLVRRGEDLNKKIFDPDEGTTA